MHHFSFVSPESVSIKAWYLASISLPGYKAKTSQKQKLWQNCKRKVSYTLKMPPKRKFVRAKGKKRKFHGNRFKKVQSLDSRSF